MVRFEEEVRVVCRQRSRVTVKVTAGGMKKIHREE